MDRPRQPDRNHSQGGRSFYFFDLDDNVLTLPTPLYLFHRNTGEQVAVSTQQFAEISPSLGKDGPWLEYETKMDPVTGSFRRFRHHQFSLVQKLLGKKQPFVEDLRNVLDRPSHEWRGPSWNFFWHAVHNGRPLSIITARGHQPRTIQEGISILARRGHLTQEPNYLSIYPVSHLPVKDELGDRSYTWRTAQLKQQAIKNSVTQAFKTYGHNPGHRFGMSDDDPENIELITQAMKDLKLTFPENSFFVIDTSKGRIRKQEVLFGGIRTKEWPASEQLNLLEL